LPPVKSLLACSRKEDKDMADSYTERQQFRGEGIDQGERVNVGGTERIASLMSGGLLTIYGLSRRSLGGLAIAALGGSLLYRGTSGHCATYEKLGLDTAGGEQRSGHVFIRQAVTINRPREELYAFWRDVENLPTFMRHIESVRQMDERRSVWTAKGTRGMGTLIWEAEIVEDVPGERILWRSLPGADIENEGEVRFVPDPGGEGTEVHVTIGYYPSSGVAGIAAAMMNPVFSQIVREDIRRFKNLMETGEVPTVEGQPRGH
jgi:uncharacterized membrane protein